MVSDEKNRVLAFHRSLASTLLTLVCNMSENWVNGLAAKVDELIGMVREINVHLKYGQDRVEKQCERIVHLEDRVDLLESENQKVKGELTMLRWMGVAIGIIATVGGADCDDAEVKKQWLVVE